MSEQSFLWSTSLKWKWLTILDGHLKTTFNLQYGKVLSIALCSLFLISNEFFPRKEKTQINSFFGTIQIFRCLINTLSKYVFMQRSTKLLGYLLLRKICFNFRISKWKALQEEHDVKTRLYLYDMGKKLSKLV